MFRSEFDGNHYRSPARPRNNLRFEKVIFQDIFKIFENKVSRSSHPGALSVSLSSRSRRTSVWSIKV